MPDATAPVETALAHANRLLSKDPALAAEQATEILRALPNHPPALLILGMAHRRRGDLESSRAVLEPLAAAQPGAAAAQYESGLTLAALGDTEPALAALRRAVALRPAMPEAWRAIGDLLTLQGDAAGADQAYARHIAASVHDPRLMAAGVAMGDGDMRRAETLLRAHLAAHATDVAAMRMMAEIATREARYTEAEAWLTECLRLAPGFAGARHNYAIVLHRQHRPGDAIPHLERLLEDDPRDPNCRNLLAACLAAVGDYARAIALYNDLLQDQPNQPRIWLAYGHVLKTAGRRADGVRAYRRSLALEPSLGEAYWSLANLKTVPFPPSDIDAMRAQLARPTLAAEHRLHFHYALGRAFEEQADYAASFTHYAQGARLRRAQIRYSAAETTEQIDRLIAFFTPSFLAERAGAGNPNPAPIFIVGLPRSGSTLLEQILSSHSVVEGTMELQEMPQIARRFGRGSRAPEGPRYPESLASLDGPALAALGQTYLDRTRIFRKQGRTYFIDKLPNNFLHVGLIRLILPNAKIIDARRAPMAAGFSNFKQHFARGQHFTYDLAELGQYYRDYARLMAHFGAVMPGFTHLVMYEDMVADTEAQVRRLLDYCGLGFEPACLRFWETERAVRTASSEQVRQPIFREGLNHWRHYEAWLEPLKSALEG